MPGSVHDMGDPAFAALSWVRHKSLGRGRVLKNSGQHVVVAFDGGKVTAVNSAFLEQTTGETSPMVRQVRAAKRPRPSSSAAPAEPYDLHWYRHIDPNVFKEWTVEDWFGEGELILPYGAPGSGKSVLIGDMACHIAAGEPWFGKQARMSAVLYVAAERAQLVERRFAAFRKHHGIDDLPIALIKGYFDMARAKTDTDRIIATVQKMKADTAMADAVVIIDTKRQVIGDENSDDVGGLVGNIARIQHETKAGVVVIDHSPFHSPTKPSGRGELVAAADATFLVEKVGGVRTAKIVKVNDGPDDLSIAFDLSSVDLGTHPVTGKVTTAPVVIVAEAPEPGQRSAGYLTPSEKIAFCALEEAIAECGSPGAGGRIPTGARTVSVNMWREYSYKRGVSDADNGQARKKAFQRARQALIGKGRIATWNDQVWIVRPSAELIAATLSVGGGQGT